LGCTEGGIKHFENNHPALKDKEEEMETERCTQHEGPGLRSSGMREEKTRLLQRSTLLCHGTLP
jgi:hypothetical protein